MTDDFSQIVCSNPDCDVQTTGKCVEGLSLEECTHIQSPRDGSDQGISQPEDVEVDEETVRHALPSGERLNPREATQILCAGESRVIAIVGPNDAGKTSLIASLYDRLQSGGLAGCTFAGSQTIVAFEQACHYSRLKSGGIKPDSARTERGQVGFYQVRFSQGGDQPLDLLLADRNGEDYRSVADTPSLASGFIEVRRADTVTVLIDAGRLSNAAERHNVRSEAQMILQGLLDGESLSLHQNVVLVLTKLDLVEGSEEQPRVETDLQCIAAAARSVLGRAEGEIEVLRVAASPTTESLPRGEGLDLLLEAWLRPASIPRVTPDPFSPSRALSRLHAAEGLEE